MTKYSLKKEFLKTRFWNIFQNFGSAEKFRIFFFGTYMCISTKMAFENCKLRSFQIKQTLLLDIIIFQKLR
jgi:hypothetical protein